MEPKFNRYIRFNGFLIVAVACLHTFDHTLVWIQQLQSGNPYGDAVPSLRRHFAVDGLFLLAWIIAAASLYQAIHLEVGILLYPIGYLFGLEVLIVVVLDVICWWNDDTEESFLRNRRDLISWTVALLYFYYTLHILGKLFRRKDQGFNSTKSATAAAGVPIEDGIIDADPSIHKLTL